MILRRKTHPARPAHPPGFALVTVLMIVSGLLVLALALLLVTTVERGTARATANREKARLAVRAGLEHLHVQLAAEAANDEYLIIQSTPAAPLTNGAEPAPYLFLARGKDPAPPGESAVFRYLPLFTATAAPADAALAAPDLAPLVPAEPGRAATFSALPYFEDVRVSWVPVLDRQNRMVARYAYWVEDLQSRVDPSIAGNRLGDGGAHARAPWPFPAPGLNDRPLADDEPALNQIGLFALDPEATHLQQGSLGETLIDNRHLLVSPGSALAAAGFRPPLQRLAVASPDGGSIGDLADVRQRAVERGVSVGLQPYEEQPRVPYAAGIHPAATGDVRLNLNALLAKERSVAVEEMASFLRRALPRFDQRKGGFPDDYIKTLAANALDYADEDNAPSVGVGYRGIDAYPFVSEFVLRSSWERIRVEGGRKFLDLSTSIYVELWNLSNVPVQGEAQVSYENNYSFRIAPNPNDISLADLTPATHSLTRSGGHWWFPAFSVHLQPNEYRVYRCGTVSYSFDAVSADEWIASPLILGGEAEAARGSGYRLRWNGALVDQSRGGIHRNDSFLRYPSTAKVGRHVNRLSVPAHSYKRDGSFLNNMGDVRMAHYLDAPQDANIYPQNYSPNRRNIREGTIYDDPDRYHLIYGRVLPSEWPDGGHDSPFGTATLFGLIGMTATSFADDHRIEPDDPRFFQALPDLTRGPQEAPMRLSNQGRFFSVSELGRVYDPMMWRVRASAHSNPPGDSWGDARAGGAASTAHGGGNTLRVGRPEHARFDEPGVRASQWLDLFHTGHSRSSLPAEREGPVTFVDGHVNLNTASRSALRLLLAGQWEQDPEIRSFVNDSHTQGTKRFPAVQAVSPYPDMTALADRMADAMIRSRPYASAGELANVRESSRATSTPLFGNPRLVPGFTGHGYPRLQWSDSAAEETFARVQEASTVRSRNFRVWIIGQALAPTAPTTADPEVLAEVRRVSQVFADPGTREPDGSPVPSSFQLREIHASDF